MLRPELTPIQARVIGCLIEKSITTPDQYPLSLNGLTLACNQKSNREPVMNLSEHDVQQAVDELDAEGLVTRASQMSGRVAKYQHRFCNTEFGQLKLSEQALGVVCVLLLRGPQTPGELRTRTNRLCEFSSVQEVDQCLHELSQRELPLVKMLAREPGKRESRWMHLFLSENVDEYPSGEASNANDASLPTRADLENRVAALENQVSELIEALEELKQKV